MHLQLTLKAICIFYSHQLGGGEMQNLLIMVFVLVSVSAIVIPSRSLAQQSTEPVIQAPEQIAAVLQAKRLIRQVLEAHESATSYQEWHDHMFNPNNWTATQGPIYDLLTTTKAQNVFCDQVISLSNEDASVFYSSMRSIMDSPCQRRLDVKMQEFIQYWQNNLKISSTASGLFGPTQEIIVDGEGGQRLIQGGLQDKELVLTFDDGPHSRLTEQLLDILDQHQTKVNFFVVGKRVQSTPNITQIAWSRGHTIGSHSMSHPDLRKQSFSSAIQEIYGAFNAIVDARAVAAPFFRFPYGAATSSLQNDLNANDIVEFFWNIDTLDWKKKNPSTLLSYAVSQIERQGSGIVLFHDIQPQTIAIMPALLKHLNANGYKSIMFRPDRWLDEVNLR